MAVDWELRDKSSRPLLEKSSDSQHATFPAWILISSYIKWGSIKIFLRFFLVLKLYDLTNRERREQGPNEGALLPWRLANTCEWTPVQKISPIPPSNSGPSPRLWALGICHAFTRDSFCSCKIKLLIGGGGREGGVIHFCKMLWNSYMKGAKHANC